MTENLFPAQVSLAELVPEQDDEKQPPPGDELTLAEVKAIQTADHEGVLGEDVG